MLPGRAGYRVQIQQRDVELLSTLLECRILTRSQAAILHFGGRTEAMKKRLQALVSSGYITRVASRFRGRSLFVLARRGYELLRSQTHPDIDPAASWRDVERRLRVSPMMIDHEIDVTSVRIAIVAAAQVRPSLRLAEICTRPARIAFDAKTPDGDVATVEPDGFVRLRESIGDESHVDHFFYLEIDRSTESQAVLVRKAASYRDHYRRGGLAARYGRRADEFKAFPFRVLITCRTAERRNNLAERLLASTPKLGAQVWMTTMAEVTASPFGAIWVTASDYGAAVSGTRFEVSVDGDGRATPRYLRNAGRDDWVDTTIRKRGLLRSNDA